MRNDYKNIHGFVTGLKAMFKKEGIPVGHWFKGRITHKFTDGIEISAQWDIVQITTYSARNVSLTQVAEILEAKGIEFEVVNQAYGQRIEIPAEKYCKEVGYIGR